MLSGITRAHTTTAYRWWKMLVSCNLEVQYNIHHMLVSPSEISILNMINFIAIPCCYLSCTAQYIH